MGKLTAGSSIILRTDENQGMASTASRPANTRGSVEKVEDDDAPDWSYDFEDFTTYASSTALRLRRLQRSTLWRGENQQGPDCMRR